MKGNDTIDERKRELWIPGEQQPEPMKRKRKKTPKF